MFELKVKDKENNGFIYKIMTLDMGNKTEEIYIKLPISEKVYLTKSYDPYVFFNIFKMMSIGGDCKIRGNVNKSFLDNLEMFIECWKIWLPDKCKDIKIIAYDEIDDEPKKLNNDAVMCFSGGLDSVSTLYRHYKGLAGRNNKNIKKLLKIGGARTPQVIMANTDSDYKKIDEEISKRIISIANNIKYEVINIDTNFYKMSSIFDWGDEFIALFISVMMLYQDTYNNLIIASDEFIIQDSIMVPHGSNPISNKFIKSNCFNLITDGEFLTRIDKMNVIKDWKYALNKIDACDLYRSNEYKLCGKCKKCMITKLNYKIIDADVDFNEIYDDPSFNIYDYSSFGEYFNIFYKEILYYDKVNGNVPKYIIDNLSNILTPKTKSKSDEFIKQLAWWIPIKKLRNKFRNYYLGQDRTANKYYNNVNCIIVFNKFQYLNIKNIA